LTAHLMYFISFINMEHFMNVRLYLDYSNDLI